MIFVRALEQLHCGKCMRRKAWPLDEGYLKLMPGMKFIWKIVLVPNPNAGNFIFSVEDFEGEDWEEFEAPSKVVTCTAVEEKEAA